MKKPLLLIALSVCFAIAVAVVIRTQAARSLEVSKITTTYTTFRQAVLARDYSSAKLYLASTFYVKDLDHDITNMFTVITNPDQEVTSSCTVTFDNHSQADLFPSSTDVGSRFYEFVKEDGVWKLTGNVNIVLH